MNRVVWQRVVFGIWILSFLKANSVAISSLDRLPIDALALMDNEVFEAEE